MSRKDTRRPVQRGVIAMWRRSTRRRRTAGVSYALYRVPCLKFWTSQLVSYALTIMWQNTDNTCDGCDACWCWGKVSGRLRPASTQVGCIPCLRTSISVWAWTQPEHGILPPAGQPTYCIVLSARRPCRPQWYLPFNCSHNRFKHHPTFSNAKSILGALCRFVVMVSIKNSLKIMHIQYG